MKLCVKRVRIKDMPFLQAVITGIVAAVFCIMAEHVGIAAGKPTDIISGVVVDDRGPVAGVSVRVQGSKHFAVSDASGNFTITGVKSGLIVNVSAWKKGYYNALRKNIAIPADGIEIALIAYQINDNPAYTWLPPEGKEVKKNCASCHPVITEMSMKDAHLNSARNPRFLTMYYGTDTIGNKSPPTRYAKGSTISAYLNMMVPLPPDTSKPYYGPGYQLDFPNTTGDCSSCHIPGASLRGNIDPVSAKGADKYGIHCDFCHKIANVHLREKTFMPVPRVQGSGALDIRRPFSNDYKRSQLFFGTFEDVNADEGNANLPLLKESRYCASCHFGIFWNTVVYNSYGEWLASPYSKPASPIAKTCQECHMPSPTVWKGKTITNVAPGKGGIERDPSAIHSHLMAVDETLLKNSLTMTVKAKTRKGKITVDVILYNDKTGHHIPTDSPIRHLIMLVEARDSKGNALALLEGPTLPEWCGTGDPARGYYAGFPGKAYAKLLKELWSEVFPTGAYWNHTEIVSDNRIAAFAKDVSSYSFIKPAYGNTEVTVTLLYRRAFKKIMDWKKWNTPDIVMAKERIVLAK